MESKIETDKVYNLNLLENGLEFILSSLRSYNTRIKTESGLIYVGVNQETKEIIVEDSGNKTIIDDSHLKYSVLNLMAGIELILKQRLYKINWKEIFTKTKEANDFNLKNGDFQSVQFKETKKRLNIHSIVFDCSNIDKLRIERNIIEHYKTQIKPNHIIPIFKGALSEIHSFIVDNLEPESFNPAEKKLYIEFLSELTGVIDCNSVRMNQISKLHANNPNKINIPHAWCKYCFHEFLVEDDNLHCLFCGLDLQKDEIGIDK